MSGVGAHVCDEWDVRPDPPCLACGKRHMGGAVAELVCLRRELLKLRGQMAGLRGELAGARHVADTYLHALGNGR